MNSVAFASGPRISVLTKNQTSLDYRLRDAPHILDPITELLHNLVRRLDDAKEVLNENLIGGVNEEIISNDEGHDESDSESHDESDSESHDEEAGSEMKHMRNSVATIIGCLFRMSMLIRKPAKHYSRMESCWSEVAMFEKYDVDQGR